MKNYEKPKMIITSFEAENVMNITSGVTQSTFEKTINYTDLNA